MENDADSYRRFLEGDDTGLVEIIREHRDGLMLFLNRYVQNIHTAEELTEDTFFHLATRRPRYRSQASFRTWLYTVGRNRALNYLRRHRRLTSLEDAADKADRETVENAFLREEQKRQLYHCIDTLKQDYALVLHLKYFEDLSNEQIAAVMKKNKRQIENLLYQAKRTLKSALEQEGFTYEDL